MEENTLCFLSFLSVCWIETKVFCAWKCKVSFEIRTREAKRLTYSFLSFIFIHRNALMQLINPVRNLSAKLINQEINPLNSNKNRLPLKTWE